VQFIRKKFTEAESEADMTMNEMSNPLHNRRSRSQKARRLKRRATCPQTGVLVLLVAAAMAAGCGDSSDDSTPPPEEGEIWNEMNWDEGSWALRRVPTVDTLG
jgi:hypothetical protein